MLQANPLTPAPEVERARPVKLVVDLDANVVRAGQRIVRVAPLVSELLFALRQASPKAVTPDILLKAIYGKGPRPDNAAKAIQKLVCAAKPALRPLGSTVESVQPPRGWRTSIGYRLARI
jgi:hypothetical protein